MYIIQYVFKLLYRVKWWLIILPLISALCVYFLTSDEPKTYNVSTTIYTGVASGFNIESQSSGSSLDMNLVNNALDNLVNIINSQRTLEEVSLRLLARTVLNGSPTVNNEFVLAENYNWIKSGFPQELLRVMDGKTEDEVVEIFRKYKKQDPSNYLYNLLNRDTPYFGIRNIQKIAVRRMQNSDMLQISYSCDDPGLAYNTLDILNKEFVKQYQLIRFGETDSVIEYFRRELAKRGTMLKHAEDSLIDFNVKNMVINYDEQTKQMAIQSRDFNLEYSAANALYASSGQLVNELEAKMGETLNLIKNNNTYIQKMQRLSDLTFKKAVLESMADDQQKGGEIERYKHDIKNSEDSLYRFISTMDAERYTKEGVTADDVMKQWFSETLNKTKAAIALRILQQRKANLDKDYIFYSPVGAMLKQKDRQIKFIENSYLDIQNSLNYALTRRQNIQMGSASLKVLNPPLFPIESEASKRGLLILGAWVATLFFIVFYVILMDRIDTTLKDKRRTEALTGGTVLGGFPAPFKSEYAKYQEQGNRLVLSNLGHSIRYYLSKEYPNVINLLSIDGPVGKTFVGMKLCDELNNENIPSRYLNWRNDFDIQSKTYIWADGWKSIYPEPGSEEVLFIELPSLKVDAIPKPLLRSANLNILVLRSDRSWTPEEQVYFDRIKKESGEVPLVILLNYMKRDDMTDLVGMFPPFTKVRNLFYKLFNFEFRFRK